MKRLIWILGLLMSMLTACEKDDAKPYAELPATVRELANNENCTCDPRIELFKWKGRLLYVHYFRGPTCDTITSFFDEKGNKVKLEADDRTAFFEEAERVETIWTCGE